MIKNFKQLLFCALVLCTSHAQAFPFMNHCLLPNCMTINQFIAWVNAMNANSVPTLAGDVVGRDMDVPGLGWIGHLGLWDGGNVVEVVPGYSNAIRFIDFNSFKSATTYWGTASANIPNFNIYGCYRLDCYLNWYLAPMGTTELVPSRYAIARRAYQAYLIGADYTISIAYISARPAYYAPMYPPRRGQYRCDTFVLDMLSESAYPSNDYWYLTNSNLIDQTWKSRFDTLLQGTILPRTVFDKLRTFN